MQTDTRSLRLALFGAAPDTGNMGVSALFGAAIAGIHELVTNVSFTVFDGGRGRRSARFELSEQGGIDVDLAGARAGRRYFLPENLAAMALASRLGRLGAAVNPNIRLIDSVDAVLDISGGDSFSDIYGAKRFFSVVRPKLIAINRARPLILLPQTYGPFSDPRLRVLAERAARGARMAWARDPDSHDNLKALLGDDFDPDRHRCGVDVAFGLPPITAWQRISPELRSWLDEGAERGPLVGVNVSGLIYNDPVEARRRFGLKADYRETVSRLVSWLVRDAGARVVLVPHVMVTSGNPESDLAACQAVAAGIAGADAGRVTISGTDLAAGEVKWLISHFEWFCGTRMHSTVAALSSSVPAAAISYSDKTAGVFDTCGQRAHVFDPRRRSTEEVADGLARSFEARASSREALGQVLPSVLAQCASQMKAIVECARV